MKPDAEEDKQRELFLELGQEDERHAPPFGQVWETAFSRARKRRWRGYFLRISAAAALLMALGVVTGLWFKKQTAFPLVPTLTSSEAAPVDGSDKSSLPWQSAVLISEWRAPTDFLLQSPGEELLKSVPRSSGSPIDSPANAPIEKN